MSVYAGLRVSCFFVFVSTFIFQVRLNYFHLFEKKLLTIKQDREIFIPDRSHHGDDETKKQKSKI
jgi:hypothetical protein